FPDRRETPRVDQGTDEPGAYHALVRRDGELAPHPLRLALRHRARQAAGCPDQRLLEATCARSAHEGWAWAGWLAVEDRVPIQNDGRCLGHAACACRGHRPSRG